MKSSQVKTLEEADIKLDYKKLKEQLQKSEDKEIAEQDKEKAIKLLSSISKKPKKKKEKIKSLATGSAKIIEAQIQEEAHAVVKLLMASVGEKASIVEAQIIPEKSVEQKQPLTPSKEFKVKILAKKPVYEGEKVTVQKGLITREYLVKQGDSFSSIFSKMGYGADFVLKLSKILIVDAGFNPSQIRFGQKFIFIEKVDDKGRNLISLQIPSGLNIIKVQRDQAGKIIISQDKKQVQSKYVYKQITVKGSIVASAARVSVPSKVVAEMTRIISNKIDASSQIYANDRLDVLYEQIYDTKGKIIDSGRVMFVSIKGKLTNLEAFRFSTNNNDRTAEFYDTTGAAFRKSITNNPFNRRYRITSGFGYRRHPVLGRRMFHSGLDYGAPPGTPIPAAGDGTIVKIGRYGGYGNYIRIKHDGTWQTAYGHMSRYASGMRVWRKVRRGEIIGYVGSTGRSTGPHLHFETLQNGRQIDPSKAALPAGKRLWGAELTRFKNEASRIRQIISVRKQG